MVCEAWTSTSEDDIEHEEQNGSSCNNMKIQSSSGGFVNVEIKGVAEAIQKIRERGKDILNGKDAKILQASNLLQQEIQESILGNRDEDKSVDTGNFANSIEIDKIKDLSFKVYTDVEYAKFLEYGTSKISPRMHFRNSLNRNKDKIIQIVKS